MAHGPHRGDLDALNDGARLLLEAGNRVAAMSLLWSAVAIDPLDVTAHRRLATTLASTGDADGAADEFARYIEFALPSGDLRRAMEELTYGVNVLGGHPALHGAAERIAAAVRALVPAALAAPSRPAAAAIPATTPAVMRAETPVSPPAPAPAAVPVATEVAHAAPPVAPRLVPKVPFRFCLHDGVDRRWMRLEGGRLGLVPEAIRVLDAQENVVAERSCAPLTQGVGHGTDGLASQPLVWAVVGIPNTIAVTYQMSRVWSCTFQARVKDEWLAIELVESRCRLRASAAV